MSEPQEDYDEDEIKEAKVAADLINKIKLRCDKAKFEYEDASYSEEFGVIDVDLTVYIPSGRKKVDINLWDIVDLSEFNKIEFEKYIIVGNYAAICCYENNTIEAAFTVINENSKISGFRKRRLLSAFGVKYNRDGKFQDSEIESKDTQQKTKIYISQLSNELKILTKVDNSLGTSIVIKASKLKSHSDAIKILEKVTHSIFFGIEVQTSLAPVLSRRIQRKFNRLIGSQDKKIEFPKYEYDSGPISLYWYARNATNMPLLQFLAFYQSIEFYYPVYFKSEFNRKVRTILKDPSFNIERDSDISRITTIASTKTGGTEREQLKATLHGCIEPEELQSFIEGKKDRAEFFSSKQKGITSCVLNFKNRNIDIISQVADRIYDIRCKVVHVKAEDGEAELELLLPYTEEAEKLTYDIELVQFLSQKVLICSSTPLKL
ncbi:hypothetical protein PSH54_01665 [Pseudoalteromonas sp. Angola-30]|uniref:hypothetical protein n=1 Tax=Pseudoalteromonas sp. Angola-30 TaxID=3025341 RepID=UPI0023597989|nr:hypothetical protein [Pseudoalteromonas sp. Angola-30]MDC9524212.1 hypothetical protein [Pseudoalteromonas sp. Angola-30]